MRLDMNIFQIAAKYAANLMGIAMPEEREALENWKQESVWHTNLAERLDQEEDFKENQQLLERFSVTEAWKKMEKNLDKAMGRRAGGRRWWKYAAVILVMLGGGFWYFQMKTAVPVKPPLIVQQSIPSGRRSAKLTLGNGKVVKLVPDGRFTLAEMDGTVIQKDSTGIDYRQIGVGEDTLVYNQMETLTGMEYTLTLSDGTRVYLNAESRLKYPVVFRGTERVVELSGEAYFKVKKNPACPFFVEVKPLEVEVTGTTFGIRAYPDETDVLTTLETGTVRVRNGEAEVNLSPDRQAIFDRSTTTLSVGEVDTDLFLAWKDGRIIFDDCPLEKILAEIGRWYDLDILYAREEVRSYRFSLNIKRHETFGEVLKLLEAAGQIGFEVNGNTIVVR